MIDWKHSEHPRFDTESVNLWKNLRSKVVVVTEEREWRMVWGVREGEPRLQSEHGAHYSQVFRNLSSTYHAGSRQKPLIRFQSNPQLIPCWFLDLTRFVPSYDRDYTYYCAQSIHEACRNILPRTASTLSWEILILPNSYFPKFETKLVRLLCLSIAVAYLYCNE